MSAIAPPGYNWIPERFDTLSLEGVISLRARLELERCLLIPGLVETTEEKAYRKNIDNAYRQIIPRLASLFVFMDGYPFDFLRQIRPSHSAYGEISVYVLLLDRKVMSELPPKRMIGRSDMPAVYVGETGKTVWDRALDHLHGHNSASYIGRNLIGVLTLIQNRFNPLPDRTMSKKVEKALAEALHRAGCTVLGGH
jgi:hypothetical protein